MSAPKSTADLIERTSRMKELAAKIGQLALEIQVETGTSVTGYRFGMDFSAALQNGGMDRNKAGEMAGALTHSFLRLHEDAVNIFAQAEDVLKELGSTEHIIEAARHRVAPRPHPETFATSFKL
jgi:hypothetical protein